MMLRRWLLVCVFLAAGCSSGSPDAGSAGPPYDVRSDVLHDATTQNVRVWAPTADAEGPWPVVFALPGISGHKSDYDLLGPALAAQGLVVYATDYRPIGPLEDFSADVACGYRLATSTAGDYGGDPGMPVTAVGYSFGAPWMVGAVLRRPDPAAKDASTAASCARGLQLPDVVVGLNGCYYDGQDIPFRAKGLRRRGVEVVLIDSADDTTCPPSDSTKAAAALQAAGFAPSLTTLRESNHYAPIFHDLVDDEWIDVPDDPAGERTVEVIVGAIEARSS